ncbi:uncharacterized protein LOC134571401 [Pelobates fuscus]|uniref:uncharacterized protein LOC134571401 n=1 Tax=Pelobates fuscus TaxID=191477 RepID=UPI002FE4402D
MSIDEYRQTINNYSLDNCKHGNQGFERVLLQLFGLPGNGKSSFINSCKFVLDGVYREFAEARASDGGCITRRVPFELTNVIMMVDNRGCPTLDKYETGEIFAQLANLLPLNETVTWCKDYSENVDRLMEADKTADDKDFIVPIFVHSIKNKISGHEVDTYRNILKTATDLTGINPLVILTHKTSGNLNEVRKVFEDLGSDKIYAIENYTSEDHRELLGKHEEILSFLCQVLKEVSFCMAKQRDPKCERKDRMKFILKYIKAADDEKRNQEFGEETERMAEEIERMQRKCPVQ